jgi:uncharacterized protein YpmS
MVGMEQAWKFVKIILIAVAVLFSVVIVLAVLRGGV